MATRQVLALEFKVRVLAPQLCTASMAPPDRFLSLVRVLGLPIATPDAVAARILTDLGAVAHVARSAPGQLERLLGLGEEIVEMGRAVLELGERIDARARAILELGERIEVRTEELLDLGGEMHGLGERIDGRGAEIVQRAGEVVQTGGELVNVIPTLERAIEMTTPLEGAIDRFGRLVDRLPGGAAARRRSELSGELRTMQDPPLARPDLPREPPEVSQE